MKTLLIILLLAIPSGLFSQDLGNYVRITDLGEYMRATPLQRKIMRGEAYGTIGTSTVYKKFQKGDIYFSDKTVLRNRKINYDCYQDQVLLRSGEDDYVVPNRYIDFLLFHIREDTSEMFKQVFLADEKRTVFMKVLYSGESRLYKYYYKTFQEADYTGPYSQDRLYDEYTDEHTWYIRLPEKEIQRLKPKKKAILRIMDSRSDEIEGFMKENKPDLKSDSYLIRLLKHYDMLRKEEAM
jgi:hypothetical protein